jgi:DNA-binding response OmpR family regulator
MGGRQVLVIEHDWRIRRLIRANLEVLGLDVWEAVGGQHGLALLGESRPNLLLLDLDLLEVDALHWLGAFQAQAGGQLPPIIMMSAEPPDRRLMRDGQAISHLQKPFAASVLLRQVRRALSEAPTGR